MSGEASGRGDLSVSQLWSIVETYAGFGDHHTGTEVDTRTTDWLCNVLDGLGAEVTVEPFEFDRFVADVEVTADGAIVPALPLFSSAVGSWNSDRLDIRHLDSSAVGNARGLDGHLDLGEDPDALLVLAFDGPPDLPVQCNRVPTELLGRPAVVIAPNWIDRVRAGGRVSLRARLEPGASANVLAEFGERKSPPVSITTPLTGWTPAASERGTGLAAAIAMAVDLAADHHVSFSACAGHELDHIGLRHHLDLRSVDGAPVIHLGASIAAIEPDSTGPASLGNRLSLTTASGRTRDQIADRVKAGNWTLVDVEPWPGEGGTWRAAGASVLSFLGRSSVFHTAADTIAATNPGAVHLATTVAIDAARIFVRDLDRSG